MAKICRRILASPQARLMVISTNVQGKALCLTKIIKPKEVAAVSELNKGPGN
jgi:hypothetical protein